MLPRSANFLLFFFAVILSLANLASALPAPAADADPSPDANSALTDRDSREFCFIGWNQRNYKGTSVKQCGFVPYQCKTFTDDLLVNHLFSAKATQSPTGGVWLWTDLGCKSKNGQGPRWVDYEGWYDLASAPAYHSMSFKNPPGVPVDPFP